MPGDTIRVHLAEKGYGSENKSSMNPITTVTDDGIVELALALFKRAGVGDWCPPGMCSLAVDFDFVQAPRIAKEALLFEPFRMDALYARKDELFARYREFFPGGTMDLSPEAYQAFLASLSDDARRAFLQLREDVLTIRIFEVANATGIGPQGLGGTMAVLDVKFHLGHAGGQTALNMQCNKAVHGSLELDGTGPVTRFPAPDYDAMLVEQRALGARLPQQQPKRIEGPLTREVVTQHLKRGPRFGGFMLPALAVRSFFDACNREAALQRGLSARLVRELVVRFRLAIGQIPDEGLGGRGIAHEIAIRAHQVGRIGVLGEEAHVAHRAPVALVQDAMDHPV